MSKPDYREQRNSKLRKNIALEAAKLMYDEVETEYFTAKRKAAKRRGVDYGYNLSDLL